VAAQYATDNEEFADGLACLSVPIIEGGAVLAALSVAAPSQRFRAERQFLLRAARDAAAQAVRGGAGANVAMLRGA
jgi:DNA-binding IclR family transcriptional regulator